MDIGAYLVKVETIRHTIGEMRGWKRTTEGRLKNHPIPALGDRTVGSITRDQLQDFLDGRAQLGLSLEEDSRGGCVGRLHLPQPR